MTRALPAGLLLLALLVVAASALAQSAPEVPPALEPWRGFALHGAMDRLCPPVGDAKETRICLFPASLSLDVGQAGADFTMRARLFDTAPVPLPAAQGAWIAGVSADGRAAPVVAGEHGPVVWLGPGEHVLAGRLAWNVAPAAVRLPADVGLVTVSRNGAPAPVAVSPAGELSLAGGEAAKSVANTENIKVFRLITDGVPLTVTTLFRLEVSGLARTVTLAGAVPAGAVALALRAPVPVTLGPDGSVALDAGPGRFDVEVVARFPGKVDALGPAACPYGRETWSFRAAPALRETRLEGAPAVDPAIADVPTPWRSLPAFAVAAGTKLDVVQLGRGAPKGRDALVLSREMWLDMSGKGLSVRDHLSGENRSAWTLAMLAPGELGRVSIAGRDQPVVLLGKAGARGVELRRARLDLTAFSRYPAARATLAAGGFDREFERMTAMLHLAPGWSLFAASGPDEVSGGLLSPWTLLDLFMAMLLAVIALSLRGPAAGLVLGLFLLLSWHEPDAPTLIWLGLLAGLGLLRLADESIRLAGRTGLRRFARWVFVLALIGLVLVSLPFLSIQLRGAVAPQILPPAGPGGIVPYAVTAREDAAPPPPAPMAARSMAGKRAANAPAAPVAEMAAGAGQAQELEYDPDALVQTGPAMPDWRFATVRLTWKGPVAVGEPLRLFLVPPSATRGLALLRALLWGAALFLLCGRGAFARLRRQGGALAAGLVMVLLLGAGGSGLARAADFPGTGLLDTLRDRLTEPPRCLPHCLGSPGLDVRLEGGRLSIRSDVDAAAQVAAPLPTVSEDWRPDRVTLDGASNPALTRVGGGLKALVGPGRHVLELSGPAPTAVSFTITAPLSPGAVRVVAPGYRVRGLDARGVLSGPLELTRAEQEGAAKTGGNTAAATGTRDIPPFFDVRRSLHFGLSWEVVTDVERRSPADAAAVASVPLLPGENPDSAEVTAANGMAEVAFPAGRTHVSWRSRLTPREALTLTAPAAGQLAETWELAAAPFYDVTYAGLPPVAMLGPGGSWQPRFAPWPGETLQVSVTRPKAAPGAFLTLERANLRTRQGREMRESQLSLRFRASKGTRHTIGLPKGASVTRLTVGGRETLATGGEGSVGFALPPGVTDVAITFRESVGVGLLRDTPAPDLGIEAASAVTRLEMPQDRWLLAVFADTFMGPAVLYWGFLAVVVALGLGLAAVPDTPLSRWQWLVYALGLSQASPFGVVLATGWLVACSWRRRHAPVGKWAFDAAQVALVVLILAGLATLYDVLDAGLLGLPRMQVAGPGSTAASLVWTWDQTNGRLPTARVVSAPLAVFRGLMLLWAAWLAFMLPRWLRFAWDSLTTGGGWRALRPLFRRRVRPETHGGDGKA